MGTIETFGQDSATLEVTTGVAGRSARLGHRLTLAPTTWSAEVELDGDEPTSLTVTVDAGSVDVIGAEGGLKPLSGPERAVARGNTHKSLKVKRFPTIDYRSTRIDRTENGFHVRGDLTVAGVTRPCAFDLDYGEEQPVAGLTAVVPVRQSDFSIKPFSLMMGTLSVADEVIVRAHAIP